MKIKGTFLNPLIFMKKMSFKTETIKFPYRDFTSPPTGVCFIYSFLSGVGFLVITIGEPGALLTKMVSNRRKIDC